MGKGRGWGDSLSEKTPRLRHAPGAVKRARRLRKTMTVSEKALWKALRALDLHIRRQAPSVSLRRFSDHPIPTLPHQGEGLFNVEKGGTA